MFSKSSGSGKRLIAEDDENYIYFNSKATPNEYVSDSSISIIPNSKARETIFIAGSSGSGKSTYASIYTQKWLQIFPQGECYLFSRKNEDPVFDKQKRIKRVKINDDLILNPINVTTDFNPNTLLIFDDIDSLPPREYAEISRLILDALEVGRSYKIYVIVINHLLNPNNKKLGRVLHNECQLITVFSKDNIRAQTYFFKEYMGYTTEQTEEIINSKDTRSITIHRHYPNYIITEKRIWSPNS
jgi:ABC-type oligopeptide transport system ATPase subunit